MDDRDAADMGRMRDDLLRFTAIGGLLLGALAVAQVVAYSFVLGAASLTQWLWPRSGWWTPWGGLRALTLWLNVATVVLLLVGSVRLWRGVRGGRALMTAYAFAALAAQAGFLVLSLAWPGGRAAVGSAEVILMLASAAGNVVAQSVFPIVVLLVLFRFAPPPPPATDMTRGFEVVSRAGETTTAA